ncbi:hypothetical protein EYF80_068414 [Liparis tanakae]|uniref:Uncharacterized protein n=1 Tax=Liparis tanakae TaxID=230148 RepID=A0A4Z2DY36_9TELE|nr:hypothetical protein EYF80_068414 [Liparis tanakae]
MDSCVFALTERERDAGGRNQFTEHSFHAHWSENHETKENPARARGRKERQQRAAAQRRTRPRPHEEHRGQGEVKERSEGEERRRGAKTLRSRPLIVFLLESSRLRLVRLCSLSRDLNSSVSMFRRNNLFHLLSLFAFHISVAVTTRFPQGEYSSLSDLN